MTGVWLEPETILEINHTTNANVIGQLEEFSLILKASQPQVTLSSQDTCVRLRQDCLPWFRQPTYA